MKCNQYKDTSLKSGVYFILVDYLNLDQPYFKYPIGTCS